ncbi:hypothetical protein LWI29_026868 [Acer saccharum]|uniref:Uncharacterized protein n=1 Tax=Acer saccharum TaxID=4024 RepID=A0AA39RDT0_ACESA|nr:hypothetical protein LWI29_026868 [Acer saccharum]
MPEQALLPEQVLFICNRVALIFPEYVTSRGGGFCPFELTSLDSCLRAACPIKATLPRFHPEKSREEGGNKKPDPSTDPSTQYGLRAQDPAIQKVNRDTLEQHAAAYVESIRLFKAPRLLGEADQVPGYQSWTDLGHHCQY